MRRAKIYAYVAIGVLFLVIMAGALLGGCNDRETELRFESLDQAETSGRGEYMDEPKLIIITGEEESDLLGATVSKEAQEALRSLDFDRYFAVAVFQGRQGATGYGVEIQRVTRQGKMVIIYAHFDQPGLIGGAMVTSPYHLVAVRKGSLQGEVEFVLKVDGKEVDRLTHTIP